MFPCFFASDLHGHADRYHKLFQQITLRRPKAVFLGGDLLPGNMPRRSFDVRHSDFVNRFMLAEFLRLRDTLGSDYPAVFIILGNDDSRFEEPAVLAAGTHGAWVYAHDRHLQLGPYDVFGYACIPPSPFLNKDWERYDVSRSVDPGCISPEEGSRTVPVAAEEIRFGTIRKDLQRLAGDHDLTRAIMLFHCPPYNTLLDRADLDGRTFEHAPLDVHIGSIAIQRFIVARQPLVTLHGHVHESARLTGAWSQRLGRTCCFSAAHDGPELALVCFDPESPKDATRELL